MLYVSRVQLSNVRCFETLDISLSRSDIEPPGWNLVLGDNATGKSTLLRSVAMGLCDEAGAAGLLKESDEGYIRRGETKATIVISLHDPSAPGKKFSIKTEVHREKKRRGIFADRVRQETDPPGNRFPWEALFVSGYGAGRGVTGTGDISSYSVIDAVYNMFNYSEGLQNPELVILRLISRASSNRLTQSQIFRVLQKATGTKEIKLTSEGIRVSGPWGERMPLRDLADGYRSSFLWLTDLIGWALAFNPRRRSTRGIRGIVLIDEIEQHLHARWQRTAIDDLRELFPNIQFIVSTHSPLVASSVGPSLSSGVTDSLYVLEPYESEGVKATEHEVMRGWRIDQVLASRAFKYQIQSAPSAEEMLRKVSSIGDAKERTEEEEELFQKVKNELKHAFLTGTSPVERAAEIAADEELKMRLARLKQ